MAKTHPYTDAHAIVWMEVGIALRDAINEEELEILVNSASVFLRDNNFIDSKDDDDEDQDEDLVLAFKQLNEDEEVTQLFHIHRTHIHYMAYEYRGWEVTRDIALNRLEPALDFIRNSPKRAKTARLILAIKDAFRTDEPESYSAVDVFQENQFFPPIVFECGQFWHHQITLMHNASISPSRAERKIFSRLEVEARLFDLGDDDIIHSSEITHRQQMQGPSEEEIDMDWTKESVQAKLDFMHSANKNLMLNILNQEMSDRIGLTGE